MISRRMALSFGGAAIVGLASPGRAWGSGCQNVALTAAPVRQRLSFANGDHFYPTLWGFNGTSPGPVLRGRQHQRLRVDVVNRVEGPLSIHWHGLRVPNAVDGVAGLTQAPIMPGQGAYVYELPLRDAGTFWYHPHVDSYQSIARGLAGPLIVDEAEPVGFDQEHILCAQQWFFDPQTDQLSEFILNGLVRFNPTKDHAYFTVNGRDREHMFVDAGDIVRLRCINANLIADLRVSADRVAWIVALDGHPLKSPERLDNENNMLSPGQRMDVAIVAPSRKGERARVTMISAAAGMIKPGYRGAYELTIEAHRTTGKVEGDTRRPPVVLPVNDIAVPDLGRAETIDILVEKKFKNPDSEQRFRQGMRERGGVVDVRDAYYEFNGVTVFDDLASLQHAHHRPLARLRQGRSYIFRLQDKTNEAHPIHIHGHSFVELAINGKIGRRPIRDTSLLPAGGTLEIAFVAEEPGWWMFHCHNVGHQLQGMMAAILVEP